MINDSGMKNSLKIIVSIAILFIATALPERILAQRANFCYKGEWSSWKEYPGRTFTNANNTVIALKTQGGQQYFAFSIDNFILPSKKELKNHQKNGKFFEYNGTVEYCVNDTYPTAEAIAKACTFVLPNPRYDQTPTVTRTASARISVAPYKKKPTVFNIWFDNIGIAISVSDFE